MPPPSKRRRQAEPEAAGSSGSGPGSAGSTAVVLTSPATNTADRVPQQALRGACRSVQEYVKLDRVGEGTYGVVYKARDRVHDQVVALKRVKIEHQTGGLPVTTLREITLLRAAEGHDNVVKLLDVVVGRELTAVFLAMEYCEQDLAALLDNMPLPFDDAQIKCLVLQLLRGLEWLHQLYIVHRDLKLSNLLLTSKGALKIADFGLARRCGIAADGRGAQPISGTVVTLWYRAPELLLGETVYDFAVDMWAAGCVMGELLVNAPLLPGREGDRKPAEHNQLDLIIKLLGTPTEAIWRGMSQLPLYPTFQMPKQRWNQLKERFPRLTASGLDLMHRFFTYQPSARITATEAKHHAYWSEQPLPVEPGMMPVFPVFRSR